MAIPFVGKRAPKRVAKLPMPGEVFTPRSAHVTDMYVERPALESALNSMFDSTEVRYLYGHSGSGKTWLYKSLFKRENVYSYVIALQELPEGGSFDDLIRHHLGTLGVRVETSSVKAVGAEAKVAGIGAAAAHRTKSRPFDRRPIDMLLETVRKFADERRAVLVFENVERGVRRPDVLSELTKIIMSVDHDSFAAHDVRILFVGTVKDLVHRIAELPDSAPILGRLETLPEVSRLADAEAKQLVEHGLFDMLQLEPVDRSKLVSRVLQRTDRLPLHIHTYCLEIAKIAVERGRKIDDPTENTGFHNWVNKRVAQYAGRVFAHMNSKDTDLKVRTRVLYCIGKAQLSEFRPLDVKNMLDSEWPDMNMSNASVSNALNELSSEAAKTKGKLDPILERVTRFGVNHYRFIDPVYRIAAGIGLRKSAVGEVEREEVLGGV